MMIIIYRRRVSGKPKEGRKGGMRKSYGIKERKMSYGGNYRTGKEHMKRRAQRKARE